MRLMMAGNVHPLDREYFQSQVLPHVDGDAVQYLGEADYQRKRELLARARCLLAPITWDEPFGLYMAEAMACGTPVVVLNRGSGPEVVRHGVTGYVVNTVAEMSEAVRQVPQIDPKSCRDHVVRNFDIPRMVDDYLLAYQRVLEAEGFASPTGVITSPVTDTIPYTVSEVVTSEGPAPAARMGKAEVRGGAEESNSEPTPN